jgi:hypothetical protein
MAMFVAWRITPARSESGWFEDTARNPRAFVKKPPPQTLLRLPINICRMVVPHCHAGSTPLHKLDRSGPGLVILS